MLVRRWLSPCISSLRTTNKSNNKTGGGPILSTATRRQNAPNDSATNGRRGTFVNQILSRPHGTKTEVYSMNRMELFSHSDANGSQERIFKVESVSGGQDESEEEPTGRHDSAQMKRGAGAPRLLFGGSSCSASKTAGGGGENRLEHGGITKQVEITIVEERSEQLGPSEKGEEGRVSGPWPFGDDTDNTSGDGGRRRMPTRSPSSSIRK